MNLLPKSRTEFGDTQYWNNFFKQRGKKAFDWWVDVMKLVAGPVISLSFNLAFIKILGYCLSIFPGSEPYKHYY